LQKLQSPTSYSVDAEWLKHWRIWVTSTPQNLSFPPGRIPKGNIQLPDSLWNYLQLVHGSLLKDHYYRQGPLPRPIAIARIQNFLHNYRRTATHDEPSSVIIPQQGHEHHCAITIRQKASESCVPTRRRRRQREPSYDELELIRLDYEDIVSPLHQALSSPPDIVHDTKASSCNTPLSSSAQSDNHISTISPTFL